MTQSSAILRYVGKLTGLYPADPLAALVVDEVDMMVEEVAMRTVIHTAHLEVLAIAYPSIRSSLLYASRTRPLGTVPRSPEGGGG
eukprot:COSAG01_NODE_5152_length_4451_cov_13.224724_3_plen_85_part_00